VAGCLGWVADFFNLVNVPFLKSWMRRPGQSVSGLMSRALWWFRWSSVVTVLAGLGYWMSATGTDARNAARRGLRPRRARLSEFLRYLDGVFALIYALIMVAKIITAGVGRVRGGADDPGSYLYLTLNNHGWEATGCWRSGLAVGWDGS